MKHLLLIALTGLLFQATAQNWQQLTDFPGTQRDDGSGFVIGDSAYFGTGMTPWWSVERDFYGLNLIDDSWFPIASLPMNAERQYASGFSSSSGKGYVFGGYNGNQFLNDLWEYNPATNTWSALTSLPGIGRSGAASFVLNDTVYIIGGKTAVSLAINEVWSYSIASNTWTQKNNFPFGNLWRSSATKLDNKGYLLFGRDETDFFHNELYEYSPNQDVWTPISNFPSLGRSHSSVSVINNDLFICFGLDSLGNSHNDVWQYDIAQNTWMNYPGIPSIGRRGGIGLAKDNKFYYTTGIDESNERLFQTWKFDPVLAIPTLEIENKHELLKIVDVLGRETRFQPNTVQLYMYTDGSIKKVMIIE